MIATLEKVTRAISNSSQPRSSQQPIGSKMVSHLATGFRWPIADLLITAILKPLICIK